MPITQRCARRANAAATHQEGPAIDPAAQAIMLLMVMLMAMLRGAERNGDCNRTLPWQDR